MELLGKGGISMLTENPFEFSPVELTAKQRCWLAARGFVTNATEFRRGAYSVTREGAGWAAWDMGVVVCQGSLKRCLLAVSPRC